MVAISSYDVLLMIQSVKRGSPFTGNILHLSVNWGETGLLSILRRVTKENDERKRRKKKIWTWCEKRAPKTCCTDMEGLLLPFTLSSRLLDRG